MNKKNRTGVRRVNFAMTTAAKTAAQMIARCANGSIKSLALALILAKFRPFWSNQHQADSPSNIMTQNPDKQPTIFIADDDAVKMHMTV